MKKTATLIALTCILITWSFHNSRTSAAEETMLRKWEFVTIRWDGGDNTHLIRSNGKVEMLGPILKSATRSDRTDERAFYMNVAMNAIAKEGYEFAGMTNDEIVMKRSVAK